MDENATTGPARRVVDRVEGLVDEHTAPEHPRAYADSDRPADRRDLRIEQRRETDELGTGLGVMTRGQMHGVVRGALIGGVLGAVLCWPLGFISWGAGVGLGWRMVATAALGAFAFAVGFMVYLGGRMPELEGETVGANNQPMDGTSPADPQTDDRGRTSGIHIDG
jgi:hypothetical protein